MTMGSDMKHENIERRLRIGLIPGDGIGLEVVPAAAAVLEAALSQESCKVDFVQLDAGWDTFQRQGAALPDETLAALRTCDGALFGAVSSPSQRVDGYTSPIIAMRRALDLYANLRPVQSAPIERSRPGIDLLIVRENTEGLYVKQETLDADGERAVAERVITRSASTRIAKMAFVQAQQRAGTFSHPAESERSPLVTIVHKANVLSVTDGLFREAVLEVAEQFPDVKTEEQLVDSMAYRLYLEPERYDVVVAPNLYGDILSDAAAALVGGLGLVPSANVGESFVLAEPVHGSAPDIAGQGLANPVATIRAAALLLKSLGQIVAAEAIDSAVYSVLADGPCTQDLGGRGTTDEVTQEIVKRIGD
jgi:homoisocitrate dehydrogenase